MTNKRKPYCENCQYFDGGGDTGTCRRYPTSELKHHSSWCGEFVIKLELAQEIIKEQGLGK